MVPKTKKIQDFCKNHSNNKQANANLETSQSLHGLHTHIGRYTVCVCVCVCVYIDESAGINFRSDKRVEL